SFLLQRLLRLRGVEGLEQLVGLLRLVVIQVMAGLLLTVTVDDRTAEGRLLDAVAVGPQREVPAGQFPLELPFLRIAEDGAAVLVESAAVVVGLLDEPLVAVLAADAFDDLGDNRPLLV